MCTEDIYEGKYRFLISKLESAGSKHCEDPKAFIEYSNNMDGIFESGDEYNPTEKRKILIAFDYMIVDILSYKKLKSVVTELFIIGRKLFLLFLSHNLISKNVSKNFTLNSTHYFIVKIPSKREH